MPIDREKFVLEIAQTAVTQAYLTGLATLSNEQFDALFLALRGINTLKKKYAHELTGLEIALMQEEIFTLLGLPLDSQYLEAKQKLKNDPFHDKKIAALRKEYAVDEAIENIISDLINKKEPYEKTRDRYVHALDMSFIEKDIDVRERREHESEAEFKSKQNLNAAWEKYNKMKNDPKTAEKAENYFEQHFIPLMKELKAQQAHKIFIVVANQLSLFISEDLTDLQQADSQTIGFFALLKELVSDLRVLGIVQHVGVSAAKREIDNMIKGKSSEALQEESFIENLTKKATKKATKKIAEKIGEELGTAGYSNETLGKFVVFMEENVALQVPESLQEDFPVATITDYISALQPQSIESAKGKKIESFFDLVDAYNKNKGIREKVSFALDVYESLSAPNEDLALIDSPNPAYLFAKALEDDALSYNYKILTEFGNTISILQKNGALGSNHEKWEKLGQSIEKLQHRKIKLDEQYEALKKAHPEHRESYLSAKKIHDEKKNNLESLKRERKAIEGKIGKAEKKEKEQAALIFLDLLPRDVREDIETSLSKLDVKIEKERIKKIEEYKEKSKNLDAQFPKENEKLKTKQAEALSDFDKETKELIKDVKINAFRKAHDFSLSYFFPSDKELNDFLSTNASLKANITSLEEERKIKRDELEKRHAVVLEKMDSQYKAAKNHLQEKETLSLKKLDDKKEKQSNEIKFPYRKFNKTVEEKLAEIDKKIKAQEVKLLSLNEEIKIASDKLNDSEKELIEISREYYKKVNEFNQAKDHFNEDTNDLLKKALNRAPSDCCYLLAIQGMVKSPHMKVNALAKAASQLPSLLDEVQLQGMTYDSFSNRVLESREVKEVLSLAEEKSVADRVKENFAQVGAHSMVDAISSHTINVAQSFVANLDRTVKAEQELTKKQTEVDKAYKKLLEQEAAALEKEFVMITVEPKKSSSKNPLLHFFKGLKEIFTNFAKLLRGTQKEQKESEKALMQSAKQFTVSQEALSKEIQKLTTEPEPSNVEEHRTRKEPVIARRMSSLPKAFESKTTPQPLVRRKLFQPGGQRGT